MDGTADNEFVVRDGGQPASRLQDVAETQGSRMGYVEYLAAVMWFCKSPAISRMSDCLCHSYVLAKCT